MTDRKQRGQGGKGHRAAGPVDVGKRVAAPVEAGKGRRGAGLSEGGKGKSLPSADECTEEARPSRTWQFSKTKMCKFNLTGMCTKGEQCPFAHTNDQLRTLPDLTCTKLCKTLIQTGVCNDPACTYAHSKDELRATSTFHKTKLCRFSQMGHCALGSKCNFAHSEDEVRPLDPTLGPDPIGPDDQLEQNMWQAAQHQEQKQIQSQATQMQQQNPLLLLQLNQHHQQQLQQQQQQLQQQQQELLQQQQHNQLMALALQQQLTLAATEGASVPGVSDRVNADMLMYFPVPCVFTAAPQLSGGVGDRPELQAEGPDSTDIALQSHQPNLKDPSMRRGRRSKAQAMQHSNMQDATAVDALSKTAALETGANDISKMPGTSASSQGLGAMAGIPDANALDWLVGVRAQSPSTPPLVPNMLPVPTLPGPLPSAASTYAGHQGGPSPLSQTPPAPSRPSASSIAGSDDFRDAPAYVTFEHGLMKSTFLENELGPIGAPIRPIRSAAGRLDLLGGDDSGDELRDLEASDKQGPYGLSSTAGLVSFGPPGFSGVPRPAMGSNPMSSSLGSQLLRKNLAGDCAASSGATSTGSSQVGLSTHSSTGLASDGKWELFNQDYSMHQKEDVWQVKNTFLTLTPEVKKPIRSIRTADGALCALSGLLDDVDDEP
eukprot:TRINITY_DN3216_c0_g1_i1.p1 TRINITY_DN3216_c0_g1~~TRINITY_DN3216_c0_g1_i1.p1  ORF type:complete len:659 (+),score=145.82 TRINITY_DN3216_c0_g1_i1:51-2027(+)